MRLHSEFINSRIELLDPMYDQHRQAQYLAVTRLYNRVLGPVTSVNLHRPELLDLSMYSSSCEHTPIGSLMRDLIVKAGIADSIFIPGGGKGASLQQPFIGALGEVAERLLAVFHFESIVDQLKFASYTELVQQGFSALGPSDLPLFSPEQYARREFSYVPFQPDTRLRWLEGWDLLAGASVFVPAQLVLVYYKHAPSEAQIAYPTTGGLAFHTDPRRSLLHGLYEVIERDAINIRWYCRLAPPRVDVDLVDFLKTYLDIRHARMCTPQIPEVQVFDNTLDIPVPVITTIAIDQARQERAFLGGGGAWSTKERALAQALFELGQTRTALKFYEPIGMKDIRANSEVSDMTDFFDAAIYFGFTQNAGRLSWYTASQRRINWSEVASQHYADEDKETGVLLDWLRTAGFRPILFDFGGAAWQGVSVMKVLIPQLTQACIPSHPYLGHPRYYELPMKLGLTDRLLQFHDLNADPVPFP